MIGKTLFFAMVMPWKIKQKISCRSFPIFQKKLQILKNF